MEVRWGKKYEQWSSYYIAKKYSSLSSLNSLCERNSSLQIPLWLLSRAVNFPGSGPMGAAVLESSKLCFAGLKEQLRKAWSCNQTCAGLERTASYYGSKVKHGHLKSRRRGEILRAWAHPGQLSGCRQLKQGHQSEPAGHAWGHKAPHDSSHPITWAHNLSGMLSCSGMCVDVRKLGVWVRDKMPDKSEKPPQSGINRNSSSIFLFLEI